MKSKAVKHNGLLFFFFFFGLPVFAVYVRVCERTRGGWLVVGYLLKSAQQWTCLAFVAPCPSIVRPPQWLPLS